MLWRMSRLIFFWAVCASNAGIGQIVHAEDRPMTPASPAVYRAETPFKYQPPAPAPSDQPLPINLPTAFTLAQSRPLDVALATERIRLAASQLEGARVLWLPSILWGGDYARHDGVFQNPVNGQIVNNSRSTLMVGGSPHVVFAVTDAIFAPLAARQVVQARNAQLQAAANDSLLSVAEAYFTVQQARGDLAAALRNLAWAEDLVGRTEKLAGELVPALEVSRARTELARRRQVVELARERWRTNSAELTRILRLEPSALVEPVEPPMLQVTLVPPESSVDELIPLALLSRPELAAQRSLVQATLERLKQERIRPLVPSLLLRGYSTVPTGSLAGGYFGGGPNGNISNFGGRLDYDVLLMWEFQNLGFGNQARVRERRAEQQVSTIELFRQQDTIAAEVARVHAQVVSAAARVSEAEMGVKEAVESLEKNLEGMGQTKRLGGNVVILVVRPQEVVAAIGAFGQAYADYFGAIAEYNRAQFRLYRALGNPAQVLATMNPIGPELPKPLQELPEPETLPANLSPVPTFDSKAVRILYRAKE